MAETIEELERGRESYRGEAWNDAYESLAAADLSTGLGADDLELLANSAYMLGREEDYFGTLERAYRTHLDAGQALSAIRCAFWIGVNLAQRGEMGQAGGVVLQLAAAQFDQAESVGQIRHHGQRRAAGALAHQPLVGSIEDDGADLGVGLGDEAVGRGGGNFHGVVFMAWFSWRGFLGVATTPAH